MRIKKCQCLVRFKNAREAYDHRGKYVAIPSLQDRCVIRDDGGQVVAGNDSEAVIRKAKELGHADPVQALIPEKDIQVFSARERII